ncbi:hypothetical protein BDR26DRAFT_941252 [Obelidium mucronatum]|nr:hypothetical protein BDR26DRAFT_941252 [Obelidium mucronatum]
MAAAYNPPLTTQNTFINKVWMSGVTTAQCDVFFRIAQIPALMANNNGQRTCSNKTATTTLSSFKDSNHYPTTFSDKTTPTSSSHNNNNNKKQQQQQPQQQQQQQQHQQQQHNPHPVNQQQPPKPQSKYDCGIQLAHLLFRSIKNAVLKAGLLNDADYKEQVNTASLLLIAKTDAVKWKDNLQQFFKLITHPLNATFNNTHIATTFQDFFQQQNIRSNDEASQRAERFNCV